MLGLKKKITVTLSKPQQFSKSVLWDYQMAYFAGKGVDAWIRDVPHYITTNPFIANAYAQMSMRLIQDWAHVHTETRNEPFYIMELGTGCGQMSFYVLKKIEELRTALHLEDLKICYLMTDFTCSNVKFWKKHPALQRFIKSGLLDFAIFDMQKSESFVLDHAKREISRNTIVNPLIAYANYVFDSIANDIFTVADKRIEACLVSLTTQKQNVKAGKPIKLEDVKINYSTAKMRENYYPDPVFNEILEEYRLSLEDSNVLMPVVALNTMANLRKFCNDRLFFIASDKGHNTLQELDRLNRPFIAFHGNACCSVMANFHAIGRYFEKNGGHAIIQSIRPGIKTNAFCGSGIDMQKLPNFQVAVQEHLMRLSPGDYFMMHKNIRENFAHAELDSLAGHMALTHWDPHIYRKLSKKICQEIKDVRQNTVTYFAEHMHCLADNFYYMPQTYDVFFDIGQFFYQLKRYAEAISYYEKSRLFFKEKFALLHNLATCQYHAGSVQEALANFKQALVLQPDSEETQKFIDYIENTQENQDD